MNQNTINRIAGMLSTAISQDFRRYQASLDMARRAVMGQPVNMSRRASNRPGCAAEKFAKDVHAAEEERRIVALREKLKKQREMVVTNLWQVDTEEGLF